MTMRVNLTTLAKHIEQLEEDKQEFIRLGKKEEAMEVAKVLNELYYIETEAKREGVGYYEVQVSHLGRNLLMLVVAILCVTLFAGYLIVVMW